MRFPYAVVEPDPRLPDHVRVVSLHKKLAHAEGTARWTKGGWIIEPGHLVLKPRDLMFRSEAESLRTSQRSPQYRLEDHGTIWRVVPLTEACRTWLCDNVQKDAQWFGGLAVEPRYVEGLVAGLQEAGF